MAYTLMTNKFMASIDALNNYPSSVNPSSVYPSSVNPSSVYQVLNVNQPAFLEGISSTLQSHDWNNGTNEGHQWREPFGWWGPKIAPSASVA